MQPRIPDPAPRLDRIPRDEEGYLLDASDWSPPLVGPLAAESGLELNAEREEVIRYIRDYFERNQSVPEARTLLGHLRDRLGRGAGDAPLSLPALPARLWSAGLQDRGDAKAPQTDAGRVTAPLGDSPPASASCFRASPVIERSPNPRDSLLATRGCGV